MEPGAVRDAIAGNIRRLASGRGLTLAMLADRAGVNTAHLYKVVKTESSPTADWIAKVAMVLEVAPGELLEPAQPTGSEPGRRPRGD